MKTYKRVLTIAGSDSGGGAGIQADIKTISACGCFAASAITAVTVQNTLGVSVVQDLPVEIVRGQIDAVLTDIGADAVKIGMLSSSEIIMGIKEALPTHKLTNIVLDPVMVSTSGHKLLHDDAIETLKNELLPCARVITPNIPEAEILLGEKIEKQNQLPEYARELATRYGVSVLLKAGHLTGEELIDVFYNAETNEMSFLKSPRQYTKNTHGTGCTLSSAFASFLAKGYSLDEAARNAKEYISQAITYGSTYEIGHGHGPVCHFWQWWGK